MVQLMQLAEREEVVQDADAREAHERRQDPRQGTSDLPPSTQIQGGGLEHVDPRPGADVSVPAAPELLGTRGAERLQVALWQHQAELPAQSNLQGCDTAMSRIELNEYQRTCEQPR